MRRIEFQLFNVQRDRLQQALLGEHTFGWSESGWNIVRTLVQEDSGGEIKSLAAATCLGVDAKATKRWEYSPSHLAYSPAGTKLLMVKYVPTDLAHLSPSAVSRDVQIWDFATQQLQQLPQPPHDSVGPVNFRSDDEPLQLVWNKKDPNAVSLWNLAKQVSVGRMACSFPLAEAPLSWSIIPSGLIATRLVKRRKTI